MKESATAMKVLVDTMTADSVPPNILNDTRIGRFCLFVFHLHWSENIFVSELSLCVSNFGIRHGLFCFYIFQYRFVACYINILKIHNTYIFFYIILCKDAENPWQSFLSDIIFSMLVLYTASAIHYEPDQLPSRVLLTLMEHELWIVK